MGLTLTEKILKNHIVYGEMVKGTELEDISWKKVMMDSSVEEQEFGYMKRGEDGNRLFAFAKWKSIKAENV